MTIWGFVRAVIVFLLLVSVGALAVVMAIYGIPEFLILMFGVTWVALSFLWAYEVGVPE